MFVAFVDYPKYEYRNWYSYFSRIFWRHSDATETVVKAKKSGLETAVVTTIAHFQFKKTIKPIMKYFDFIMTGYEARCDKTNPKMYRKVLEILKVKPDEAVMIGDDIQVDILLPKRLGTHAILLDRKAQNLTCQGANAVVNNLREALEIILGFKSDRLIRNKKEKNM